MLNQTKPLEPEAINPTVVPTQQTLAKHIQKARTQPKSKKNTPEVLTTNTTQSLACKIDGPAHKNLLTSPVSQLRKLYDYELACKGAFTDRMMIFEATPANLNEAKQMANDVAFQLKAFAKVGISPLVILEPNTSQGLVNFSDYANGSYDSFMDSYFSNLKSAGITNEMMGMWTSFPEANIPVWQTTKPSLFSACVTRTVKLQKKYFPSSKASILLETKSYPNGWNSGSYSSLSPYVKGIPVGLLDSFGLQGFAWPDPQPDYNATHFLNPSIAIAAAKQLGVKSVWFNTGTFNKGKAYNGQIISLQPVQRQEILNNILAQAKIVRNNGFSTAINLFSANKLATDEGIDWSYWLSGSVNQSPSKPVFTSFVYSAKTGGIKVWLFDADD